jgi:Ca2+-binding RTX toxin-like protein
VGLGSSPFCSGSVDRNQGISKAGNSTARSMMIELAWTWLRYQPGRCRPVGGADYLYGGTGIDTALYADSPEGVWVDLQSGYGHFGTAQGDKLFSIENVHGSAYQDTLIGNAGANAFYGLDGSDVLEGWGGADYLDGGYGNDSLNGGSGADVLNGRPGADTGWSSSRQRA